MTEQQRLEIAVGMRVMVKVAAREIPATVVEVGENWFLVRSEGTGREFRTSRVVDILGAPGAEVAEIAQAAAEEPVEPPEPRKASKASNAAKGKGKPAPKKKLSLLNAAIEVLRQEARPLNTRELVKLAKERRLWVPTACRTPEQSLYGAFFLEIKNSDAPRVRKSAERGKFELA